MRAAAPAKGRGGNEAARGRGVVDFGDSKASTKKILQHLRSKSIDYLFIRLRTAYESLSARATRKKK